LGVKKKFDIFGVLFLAFVVSVVGGMIRDLLIGAIPPAALTNLHYFAIAMAAGLLVFYRFRSIARFERPILIFDATGLALFAVTGAQKAIEYGINPLMAALLGMLTGIGGGMTRDVLANDVPFVLRSDLYAIAALVAAAAVSTGHALGISPAFSMPVGAGACVLLRLMAIYRGWRAPVADDTA
jgi:uncharacterized membrane protein YeiH